MSSAALGTAQGFGVPHVVARRVAIYRDQIVNLAIRWIDLSEQIRAQIARSEA